VYNDFTKSLAEKEKAKKIARELKKGGIISDKIRQNSVLLEKEIGDM
jgi:hypothetical protein